MNPAANLSVTAKTALAAVASRGRGPERISPDKGLGGDGGNWDKRQPPFRPGIGQAAARQNGTVAAVPERHRSAEDVRLSSSFVAQLLGQVLPHQGAVPSRSGAAYGQVSDLSSQLDRQF